MIALQNAPASAGPQMTGAIYCDRSATHIDHQWIYWDNPGVFFEGELGAPHYPADSIWDARALLDSGSNVHMRPEV